jgi:hypothetical protein
MVLLSIVEQSLDGLVNPYRIVYEIPPTTLLECLYGILHSFE